MKKSKILFLFLSLFLFSRQGEAQDILGKWENTNDAGKVNSIIEIYEEDGEIHGKVIRIMKEEDRDRKCSNCPGKLKNKPIEGLDVISGFEKDGSEYVGGIIIDPNSGKEYKGKLWIDPENPNILNVRGYIAFFYKTKVWQRADESQ